MTEWVLQMCTPQNRVFGFTRKRASPMKRILAILSITVTTSCVQTSPTNRENSNNTDTAQITIGSSINRAILKYNNGSTVLDQWKDNEHVVRLFNADKAPILELLHFDSAKIQYKFNEKGRLIESTEILLIDSQKYLNQAWSYDIFGTINENSSFYRYRFINPDSNYIVLSSAFPWFKDSLVFHYDLNGITRHISSRDSIIIFCGLPPHVNGSIVGLLSEYETRIDTTGNQSIYARDFYVRIP